MNDNVFKVLIMFTLVSIFVLFVCLINEMDGLDIRMDSIENHVDYVLRYMG